MDTAAIAFCADKTMECALHVAALSAVTHLDPACAAQIYIVAEGFSAGDQRRFEQTISKAGRPCQVAWLHADLDLFAPLPALHGSRAVYMRLLLPGFPQTAHVRRLLYIDVDTRTTCDLAPLFQADGFDMGDAVLAAVVDGTADQTLDRDLRASLGQPPDAPAFNSGVLLIDCDKWRDRQVLSQCLAFGKQYADRIRVVDQTILNCLFAQTCARLPEKYNAKMWNHAKNHPQEGILHYVGSPKPWDIGAGLMLPYAQAWFQAAYRTAMPYHRINPWLNPENWKRLPGILGGYRRVLLKRRGR